MSEKKWTTYLFEYEYDGAQWLFEIKAYSPEDALLRMSALSSHVRFKGELGIFAKLACWIRSRRNT